MKPEDLFNEVSRRTNYLDINLIKDVYYSLVKVMVSELKRQGIVRLPDFGDLFLIFRKEKYAMDISTRKKSLMPQKRIVKFQTDTKLKKYLNS